MTGSLRPASVAELQDFVRSAAAARQKLAIRGGGTKSSPAPGATMLDTTGLAGITLYEPAEMVIAARAGTPLALLEAALAKQGQMLPFEPMDWRPLLGTGGEPTVGGTVAAAVSGPRRISAGACRDALIGAVFVNGRGEETRSGGRVMKNVTGYDLVKLQTGARGTLGVLTELTFKVLPQPADTGTLVLHGLNVPDAVAAMSAALGSPFEVSAAAYLPGEASRTLLRLEHFPESIADRGARLAEELAPFGAAELLGREPSQALWREVRDVRALAGSDAAVWRVSVASSKAPAVVRAAEGAGGRLAQADWGGGLLWIAGTDGSAIRVALRTAGGHATLARGPESLHAAVGEAESPTLQKLAQGLRAVFDPAGVLNVQQSAG